MTRAIYRSPWRIDVTVRDGVTVPTPLAVLARAIAAALDAARDRSSGAINAPASIGLILADDAELAALKIGRAHV